MLETHVFLFRTICFESIISILSMIIFISCDAFACNSQQFILFCLNYNDNSVRLQADDPAIFLSIIAAMPPGIHPVCPLASSNWRCPPECPHCIIIRYNMSPGVQSGHLIPRTPLVSNVSTGGPSPASCKVLTQKFSKHRSWSKWQREYEKQGGTWPYSSPKWQDNYPLGG